ncbi:toll/interleukin-1 receptor domain-containing protein [uncultured Methanobacterium sp.]|uniref:toll/interleukin-1 receptor domain-containing protein n=1 Tax=uncultured Methanobacterium sp. TaxID=176306 RepID=UPI002AA6C683|nr:toll/interleukin-1 receptor domain-containing protein [uncultured Methanobacterium sp.]
MHRVFISYSHTDKDDPKVHNILEVLKNNGLTSTYDKNLLGGWDFKKQIEVLISHCDIFIAILSENSEKSGWVQAEIGYAMSKNIPILPISIDETEPGHMISQLQAPQWVGSDEEKNSIIKRYKLMLEIEESNPTYECADNRYQRTGMLVEYASNIIKLGFFGEIRQIAGLSSFHIPNKGIHNSAWDKRYTGMKKPSDPELELLLKERKTLQLHGDATEYYLIINPDFTFKNKDARKARIEELLEFLNVNIDNPNLKIVIDNTIHYGRNLTIVGDWFTADAYHSTLDDGYSQTLFTRHAPTVRKQVEIFDARFNELLNNQKISDMSSVQVVIDRLESILKNL